MARTRWTYRRRGAQHWELVLADAWDYERVERAPGYESKKLGDILEACWYLNNGFQGHLTEARMKLLDQFKD